MSSGGGSSSGSTLHGSSFLEGGHPAGPGYGSIRGAAPAGYGPGPTNGWTPPSAAGASNGLAIAGFVVGFVGFLLSFVPFVGVLGWPLVIVGFVLSVVGLARSGERGNRGLAVAGTVLSVLGLLVCIVYAAAFSSAVGNTALTPAAPAVPSAAAPSTDSDAPIVATFGSPITFVDGVEVSVGPPTTFSPSETAAGADGAANFQVTVTIRNGSPNVFQPSLTQVSASVDGQDASEIFDSAKKVGGAPDTSVLPGKTVTFKLAFSAPASSGDLQVDVRPGFDYKPATFTGRL